MARGRFVAALAVMAFTSLLCPVDFSPGSQRALRVATQLARDSGAKLVVAHAWYMPSIAYADTVWPPETLQEIVDYSRRSLDSAVNEAIAAGARASGKLLAGPAWSAIVDELSGGGYDLCVIGTHGRTGWSRVLLGSVAEKVVRHAPCSVLVPRGDGAPAQFHHALVPTDFSSSAERALDIAAVTVGAGATVSVLHIVELPITYAETLLIERVEMSQEPKAAAALEQEVARVRGASKARFVSMVRQGYPAAETLFVIDDDPTIDLVVMGSAGRTGIKRALLGSVAEKVVRHARCSVLVARPAGS